MKRVHHCTYAAPQYTPHLEPRIYTCCCGFIIRCANCDRASADHLGYAELKCLFAAGCFTTRRDADYVVQPLEPE